MPDGEMRGRVETENRLHNAGAAQQWDRRLPGELPDTHVFRFLHRLKLAYFDRQPVGRLVTRVTSDTDAIGEAFASGALNAVGDLVRLVGIVVMMLRLDWMLSRKLCAKFNSSRMHISSSNCCVRAGEINVFEDASFWRCIGPSMRPESISINSDKFSRFNFANISCANNIECC